MSKEKTYLSLIREKKEFEGDKSAELSKLLKLDVRDVKYLGNNKNGIPSSGRGHLLIITVKDSAGNDSILKKFKENDFFSIQELNVSRRKVNFITKHLESFQSFDVFKPSAARPSKPWPEKYPQPQTPPPKQPNKPNSNPSPPVPKR